MSRLKPGNSVLTGSFLSGCHPPQWSLHIVWWHHSRVWRIQSKKTNLLQTYLKSILKIKSFVLFTVVVFLPSGKRCHHGSCFFAGVRWHGFGTTNLRKNAHSSLNSYVVLRDELPPLKKLITALLLNSEFHYWWFIQFRQWILRWFLDTFF